MYVLRATSACRALRRICCIHPKNVPKLGKAIDQRKELFFSVGRLLSQTSVQRNQPLTTVCFSGTIEEDLQSSFSCRSVSPRGLAYLPGRLQLRALYQPDDVSFRVGKLCKGNHVRDSGYR